MVRKNEAGVIAEALIWDRLLNLQREGGIHQSRPASGGRTGIAMDALAFFNRGENAVYAGSDLDVALPRAMPQHRERTFTSHSRRTQKPHSTERAELLTFSFDSTFVTFCEHLLTFY
jgi:hypothetical protein